MKLGYPCINNSIGCTANQTFRLRNYSAGNLKEKVKFNLDCLKRTLDFNLKNNLLFFRIGSGLVPFASHPICRFDWVKYFRKEFIEMGNFIRSNSMRISMHPDQFVVLNAKDRGIVRRSVKELEYHCRVLDAMGLDRTAKVQIHLGGVYGDKDSSMKRFMGSYRKLPSFVKKRFVIENDERSYSLKDCLTANKKTGIPVVFDVYHHECNNNGEKVREALLAAKKTWKKKDGNLIVHYSSQKRHARKGSHAEHIDTRLFKRFLDETKGIDFDIMLEIKDKEKSALKAVNLI
ncbi:UV DNA damage repair endonuclease UvsE [Candidatus Woesearchaeota archaeon]|nr:UV DNA damage repair endonuclease UvsE [Candidatus Woesearchaeota archaeon]